MTTHPQALHLLQLLHSTRQVWASIFLVVVNADSSLQNEREVEEKTFPEAQT